MSSDPIKMRLKALLKEESLVDEYISKFGSTINMANIKSIRESGSKDDLLKGLQDLEIKPLKLSQDAKVEEENEVGDDPIYEGVHICPVCKNSSVTSYNLLAKSQFITETHFLVPQYAGIGKYRKVDFNRLKTIVCDSCLFASPDPKDFGKFNKITDSTVSSQLTVNRKLIFHLADTKQDRLDFIKDRGMSTPDFTRPRSVETAITSIHLSILRAKAENSFDLHNTLFKIGAYYLKIAQLEKDSDKDNLSSLKLATEHIERAVLESDCTVFELEMESLYLAIALNIKLKEKDKMASFFKLLKDVKTEVEEEYKENPVVKNKKKLATVDKWESRAKTALEYREDEEFWRAV